MIILLMKALWFSDANTFFKHQFFSNKNKVFHFLTLSKQTLKLINNYEYIYILNLGSGNQPWATVNLKSVTHTYVFNIYTDIIVASCLSS